ncbi:MAG TPA: beta-propeller domain-containing protein [bacterium]|nr:beta-propeller domain-containing protein [bacterium]HPT30155.1 beta-propeller domain-containing protein [bacterium]
MGNFKNFKTLVLILVVVAVLASFAVLKIKQFKNNKPADQNNISINANDANRNLIEKLYGSGEVKKFADASELKTFLESQASQGNYSVRSGLAVKGMGEMAVSGSVPTAAPAVDSANGQGVSTDYSKTNVQVEGVDEADIIKTDGEYIYAVVHNVVFVIKAYPADTAQVVAKIKFDSRPQEIYVENNRLVVFGSNDQIYARPMAETKMIAPGYYNNKTFVKVFDLADKQNPQLVKDLQFDGNYFNSRLIGDYVYVVLNNYNFNVDSPLPQVLDGGQALDTKCAAGAVKCFEPDIYYFDIPYDNYQMTTVASINIKDSAAKIGGDLYLMNSSQNFYVSPENLYISYTRYINEYDIQMELAREIVISRLSDSDRARIMKIDAADEFILSKSEKRYKVQQIIDRYVMNLSSADQDAYQKELTEKMKQKYADLKRQIETTVVYKITAQNGELTYQSKGEVPGSVLNQFSMDESNGYFRIATTYNQIWSNFQENVTQSYNNIYVLNSSLQTVGKIEDLATGERIYSARFMGDRLYLVTFKRTDPLFVVDLSNPQSPQVAGELKVPGFSTYLHPYDQNTMIGFGKDADDSGEVVKTKGLKLALFDVSDIKNPKVLDTYVMGDMGSDSVALYDHKAFLFSKEKNVLSLPVTLRQSGPNNSWGDVYFSGALVFQINANKFVLAGKIDHSDGGQKSASDYSGYYDNNVLRSLYINDQLYTFSNWYLKANRLPDLKETKKVELDKNSSGFVIIN